MALFAAHSLYVGPAVPGGATAASRGLTFDDGGFLSQSFRRSLLDESEHFLSRIEIAGLPPLELDWRGIGQTAGVALWARGAGGVLAASVLTNGVEVDDEFEQVRRLFAVNSLAVPLQTWAALRAARPPVFLTVYPTVESLRDDAIGTAAPALANAFFTIFGTAQE